MSSETQSVQGPRKTWVTWKRSGIFAVITKDDHDHQLWLPDQAQGQVGAMSLIGLPYPPIPIRSERDTKRKAMRRERNEIVKDYCPNFHPIWMSILE